MALQVLHPHWTGYAPESSTPARSGSTSSKLGWLDLCCGRGRALLHAADELLHDGILDQFRLIGVDLVNAFDVPPQAAPVTLVTLVTASVVTWQPPHPFDLITCVHGLH